MSRHDLTDWEWNAIRYFLPAQQSRRGGRPWSNHRQVINGILWILKTGSPWRDLPSEFGKRQTVYNRFRRWTVEGLWDRIYERLLQRAKDLQKIGHGLWCIDGSVIRAHRCASGMIPQCEEHDEMVALGRSRGGYSTKLNLLTDGNGNLLSLTASPGQSHESTEVYIASMRHEGWQLVPKPYDDGGFTGGNMERPALHRLLADIEAGKIDCVVVYKVNRLSRSLMDFARMMNVFEKHGVSFVSVTQQFNTASSMGRLILNVLLSFAQFEREMISERVRDKITASRRKGKYVGGQPILGYNVENTKLIVDATEADQVRQIFQLYLEHQAMLPVVTELNRRGWLTKRWVTRKGVERGAKPFTKNSLHNLLTNIVYIGKIRHKENVYEGEHEGIVPEKLFERTRKTLKRNSRSGGSAVRNQHGALLRGILRCECCDAAMSHTYTSKGSRQYRYYVCGRARQRGWGECPSPSIPAGEIEHFVVEQIREIGSDPELIREVTAKACEQASAEILKLQQERQTLLKQIRSDFEQIESIAASRDMTSRVSTLADLNKRQETARRRLDEIELEFESLTAEQIDTAEVSAALSNFHELWAQLRPKEQARLLALLIEQVDHDGRHGNVSITFHPTGIRTLMQESVDLCEVAV